MNYKEVRNVINVLYAAVYFLGFVGGIATVLLLIAKLFGIF